MEFPARNDRHATQQNKKKQRENRAAFKDLDARNDASEWEIAGVISCPKNGQDYGIFMIDSSAVATMKTSNPAQNDL